MLQKYNEISVTPHQFFTQKTPTPTHILGMLRFYTFYSLHTLLRKPHLLRKPFALQGVRGNGRNGRIHHIFRLHSQHTFGSEGSKPPAYPSAAYLTSSGQQEQALKGILPAVWKRSRWGIGSKNKSLGSVSSFGGAGSVERYNDYYTVRPLLSVNRFEIGKFCSFWQLPIYPDISNQKVQFSRNRIRRQLLPVIKLFFNPKIENTLLQFAEITEAENRWIDQVTQNISFAYYPLLLPRSFIGLADLTKSGMQPFRSCKVTEGKADVEKSSYVLQGDGLLRMPFGVTGKRVMGSIKTKPLAQRLFSKQYPFPSIPSYGMEGFFTSLPLPPAPQAPCKAKGLRSRWDLRSRVCREWKHCVCEAERSMVANPREGLCLLSSYFYVHRREWSRHSRVGTQKAKKTRFQSNTLALNSSSHYVSQQKKVENFFIRNFFVYFDKLKTEKKDLYWPLVISFLPTAFQRRVMKSFLINQNWKKIRYSQVEDFLTKRTKL